MLSQVLPIGTPVANGYQFYAYPLAILDTNPATEDWILSNYVQLAFDEGEHSPVPFCFFLYDYAICPWLDVVRTTRSWIDAESSDMAATLCRAVDRGYYPYLMIDEYHVPHRETTGKAYRPHDILVYGYDAAVGEFHVLGYDEEFEFRPTRLSFEGLRKGHASLDEHGLDDTFVNFIRLRPTASYGFDLDLVRVTTEEYLTGANTSRHFSMLQEPWDRAYGMDVYACLRDYLRRYVDGGGYDIRHLHVLWEHKKLMARRIRRAADFRPSAGQLIAQADQIEVEASTLRNAHIRDHIVGGRPAFLAAALARLEALEAAERELLGAFVSILA